MKNGKVDQWWIFTLLLPFLVEIIWLCFFKQLLVEVAMQWKEFQSAKKIKQSLYKKWSPLDCHKAETKQFSQNKTNQNMQTNYVDIYSKIICNPRNTLK